jgi:signal transduction histidine kinase/HD-like signal output (HDOD) protein
LTHDRLRATGNEQQTTPAMADQSTLDIAPACRDRRRNHVELILRQVESLPTLPHVAVRLLDLAADDQSSSHEVVELISCDPALTAKVLTLCRRAAMGVRHESLTVERAVVLLGFSTIRNAVLSVKVFEVFDDLDDRDEHNASFDRAEFWRHSLAVAVASELIASCMKKRSVRPAEAFVCGLLHDLGKLALDHVLPRSYRRVVDLAQMHQADIARFERRVIGLDHHTAGKRLAEHWQLPCTMQDCMWLHGTDYESLPGLEHRDLIGVVSLADLLVRRHHIGYSGNHAFIQDEATAAEQLGAACDEQMMQQLYEQLERRCDLLGLGEQITPQMFLRSIQSANETLARINVTLERRGRASTQQAQLLQTISTFHEQTMPGHTVQDVMDRVARGAASILDGSLYVVLHQPHGVGTWSQPGGWLLGEYDQAGEPVQHRLVEPDEPWPDLADVDPSAGADAQLLPRLTGLDRWLTCGPDVNRLCLLPLSCGWGTAGILIHDDVEGDGSWPLLKPLASTWGAAIAAVAQHKGASRVGEQLAEANHALAEAKDRLLKRESLARLGEMAAGAAHEMNNPLAVISGRSQMLAADLPPGSDAQQAAQSVTEQAQRLSQMITCLHLFAQPPAADRKPANVAELLARTAEQVRDEIDDDARQSSITVSTPESLGEVSLDEKQIEAAVCELLVNAVAASGCNTVSVSARFEPIDRRLLIQVTDDGEGMAAHVLSHATDPFFSARPADRGPGLGLARAAQWARAHDGELILRSKPGAGTTAVIDIAVGPSNE